jgi:hypothetical protein
MTLRSVVTRLGGGLLRRRSPAAGQPLLAFVHMPRTGGGTLSSAIAKNYAPLKSPGNFQRGPEKTRLTLSKIGAKPGGWHAVGDHVPYGLFLHYLPADTRYVTILRDPVDRVLSHYHFHAQVGDPPGSAAPRKLRNIWEMLLNHERLEREGGAQEPAIALEPDAEFSLEEGLRRKIAIYDNFMTRFLWGGESLFGELPPDALERAKENISSFYFVGVRERLDESIVLLGRKLGVGLMPYYLRHVSQKRPPLEETSDELRALIAEHNSLDVELYRFARERFDEEAPASSELEHEVAELRAGSAKVTSVAEEARTAKKEAGRAARRRRKAERGSTSMPAEEASSPVPLARPLAVAPEPSVQAPPALDGDVQHALEVINLRLDALTRQLADLEVRISRDAGRKQETG